MLPQHTKKVSMTKNRWLSDSVSRGEYAGEEDFANKFEREHEELQRLAFLLTADAESAARCVRLAFRQCIASNSVFKGWALNWARRLIIRNAVSLTMGPGEEPIADRDESSKEEEIACLADHSFESIVNLTAFERCAYVICILEGYSTSDCALLLGRPAREINKALNRIRRQEAQLDKSGQWCPASREPGRLSEAEETG